MAIGYSGYAYLDGVPTDQWIAQRLRGKPLGPGRNGRDVSEAMSLSPSGHWLDIGQTLYLLQKDLKIALAKKRPRSYGHEDVLEGWQWKRAGRCRPIIAWLTSEPRSPEISIGQLPRYWHHSGHGVLCCVPDSNLTRSEKQALVAGCCRSDRNEAEKLLVEAIRTAARYKRFIGENCMSILLPPPGAEPIRVRYFDASGVQAELTGAKRVVAPAAFTPWVIGPRIAVAPSIWMGEGSFDVSLEHFQVRIEGVEGSPKGFFALSSQRRPPGA